MQNKPIFLTHHARQAMMLRRVSMDDVLKVINTPEVTDSSTEGTTRYFRDQLCVVTSRHPQKIIVKTVLYRYGDTWTDSDVRKR